MVNTFSIPIGIGVHDRGHVFTIVESGIVCVSADPCGAEPCEWYSAFKGSRNPIFWIEVAGGTLDPKNWTKTGGR